VSGTDFTVDDGEKVLPHVFELSMGVDRSLYAILESSMRAEGERKLLTLKPYLSPMKAGVFPLVNKDGIPELAQKVYSVLANEFDVFLDDSGSIGRRYARADEVGVPCCVTIDYDSLKDMSVTVRDRDTRSQERVKMDTLASRIGNITRYPSVFD
jgi:glycyl-tRNA synthetase